MTDTTHAAQAARRVRHEAILSEVAAEEVEAAEAEAVERSSALDVPLHLRIDEELDQQLRQRASDEHIPTSALVRRLLRRAVQEGAANRRTGRRCAPATCARFSLTRPF